ncbi:MAG: DNA/RNA non-specific endonuclease [Bacteroidales bacterium]|nr:DNA/RNA non-specific endonuclease [Bacteroidales bacterium]
MKRYRLLLFFLIIAVAIIIWIVVMREPGAVATFAAGDPVPALILEISDVSDGFPALSEDDTVISYSGFHLVYNEEFEQASWVAYILKAEQVVTGGEERTDNFRADTSIVTGSATPSDYLRSGFDRGHLAPAADMKWSAEAMSESFLMSNMSPQVPGFNRGVWNRLEAQVRDWAAANDSILVITGPVLTGIDEFIGPNRVGVPKYYFKIIADISPPTYKVISFLLGNSSSTADLFSFVVTIDSIESLTGYDFFTGQPDISMIERMESATDIRGWR